MKNMFKRIVCGVLTLLFVFTTANVALAGDVIQFTTEEITPRLYNSAPTTVAVESLEDYIDIESFQAYLLKCVSEDTVDPQTGYGEIDITQFNIKYSKEIVNQLVDLIYYESPELFRIAGFSFSYYPDGNITTLFPRYMIEDLSYYKEQYKVFEDVTKKLLLGIKGNTSLTDAEKALFVHDRLAEYCEYNYGAYLDDCLSAPDYSAYGILCLGTGVCQGYALAYDYLLEQVGVEARYCSSADLNHAWNIVYIDGKQYYVDVTWDDPVWDVSGCVYHNDFLVSPAVFKQSHDATDYEVIPEVTTYDNAFWRNVTTAFQLVDNKVYYINDSEKIVVIDNIADTTPEEIVSLDFKWYTRDGGYYTGASKLASLRGKLYYSSPKEVYCYDPATKQKTTVLTETESLESTGDEYLHIFGLTAYGCHVWGEYSEGFGYDENTKKTHVFSLGFHNPTENWVVVIEPTYSSEGKEKNYCIDCGSVLGSRIIPALEDAHVWTDWYVDINNKPTCTEKGVEKRDCTHCDIFEWRYAAELGHNYSSSYTVDWAATCKETGRKSRHCTRCSAVTDITEIPVTNVHIKGDAWIKGKAPTCKTEGYNYKACKICGTEMEREILPVTTSHNLTLVGAKASTCTEKGYSGDLVCTVCSKTTKGAETPAKGHSSSEWIIDKAPTATETGSKHKECTVCKSVLETAVIEKNIILAVPVVKTSNTEKGITVTWGAVENAEKYVVYQRVYNEKTKKYSAWKAVKTTTELSYTDTTVKLGTIYSYTVKAVTGSVQSKFTATKGLRYNVTPTVKTAMASNGIKVTWSTAANATGYTVYSSTYNTKTKKWSGWTSRGTTTKTSWTDTKAKSGTQYRYTVRAKYNTYSSAYNKNGTKLLFLAQPTVKIANNASGVKISWNKITGATGYAIYRSEQTNGAWSSWKNMGTIKKNTTVSWVDKSAVSGKTYRYTVRAVNGSVMSTYKASNTVLYLAQPKVTFANAAGGMKVSWNKVAGATGYKVYSSTYNAKTKKWSSWTARGTVTATSWTDTSAKSGTYYKYTVKAVNGSYSSTYMATSGLIRLAQPTVKATLASGSVKVTWNKIAGATGYRVYRKVNGATSWTTVATINDTSYFDTSILGDNSYTYTVRAYKGSVWSSYNTNGVTVNLDYKKAVFDLVNAERKKAGLDPLEYYSEGQVVADIRAKEIIGKFDHERPDGTMCFTVLAENNISYYSAGENIAKGHTTPEIVMNAWMNSPGHKANILNANFTHIIIGYDAEANAWVQLFLGYPVKN